MLSRHEEKYILDYRQYLMLRNRAMAVLTPDENALDGSYVITSLYFDDPLDTALYEKLDGLQEHSKFRLRTYGCSSEVIKLERKDKQGIMTKKISARVPIEMLPALEGSNMDLAQFSGAAYDLAAQMTAQGLQRSIAVRYRREAFCFPGSDLRLTFDTELQALRPDLESLTDPTLSGVPVLPANQVIMEIKYNDYLPSFVRKLTNVSCKQLSVSKYALCRARYFTQEAE